MEERSSTQCDFRTSWASVEGDYCAHVGGGYSVIEADPCRERQGKHLWKRLLLFQSLGGGFCWHLCRLCASAFLEGIGPLGGRFWEVRTRPNHF